MWLFRRKRRLAQEAHHKKELAALKSKETKRYNKAVKPIKDFNDLLANDGIILEIKKGLGGRHV